MCVCVYVCVCVFVCVMCVCDVRERERACACTSVGVALRGGEGGIEGLCVYLPHVLFTEAGMICLFSSCPPHTPLCFCF